MKIKLIAPDLTGPDGISTAGTFKIERPNLALLAALTPPGHEITLVDESFAPDDTAGVPDLVGISVMTSLAPRAYAIADAYRSRGAKVVLGGIHATVLPGEAAKHADAVAVGEGEALWPRIVADAGQGKLERIYRAPGFSDLARLPRPARDLYPRPERRGYAPLVVGVETARGCPFGCEFCSTTAVLGAAFRVRPRAEVLRELEAIDNRNVFFVDDSLGGRRDESRALFEAMIPLGKHWIGQGPARLAEDVSFLRLMRRSGCRGILVGFESVSPPGRAGLAKIRSLTISAEEAIRRFHGEGISLFGAFVFGFDGEDASVFERTTEFILENRIDAVTMRTLCPYPGTRLYSRLSREGRLLDPAWWLKSYPKDTLLFELDGMSPDEFRRGFEKMVRDVYCARSVFRRFWGVGPLARSPEEWLLYAGVNLGTRRQYERILELGRFDWIGAGGGPGTTARPPAEFPFAKALRRQRRGRIRVLPPELPL